MSQRSRIPDGIVCAADYEACALQRLSPELRAHIEGGSGEQRSLRANRHAFERLQLYGRVLASMAGANTLCTLAGASLRHPILLAPAAYQTLLHPDGERASARGAAATDSGMVVSTLASCTLEAIAAEAPTPRWLQLYWQPRREDTLRLLRRAEDSGYGAIVWTLDTPVQEPVRAAQRLGFRMPADCTAVNLADLPPAAPRRIGADESPILHGWMAAAPDWNDLDWLRQQTALPLLAKGVTHPDDAARLLAAGVAGIVVSNHGGRALDGVPASLDLLPAIRERVGADATVLLDGGIRSGSDVFKALARGADAVLVGRLPLYALAVAGDLGVAHLLKLLREELELCMALTGCATLAAIGPAALAGSGSIGQP